MAMNQWERPARGDVAVVDLVVEWPVGEQGGEQREHDGQPEALVAGDGDEAAVAGPGLGSVVGTAVPVERPAFGDRLPPPAVDVQTVAGHDREGHIQKDRVLHRCRPRRRRGRAQDGGLLPTRVRPAPGGERRPGVGHREPGQPLPGGEPAQ